MRQVKKTLDKMHWSGWLVIERSRDAREPNNVKKNFGSTIQAPLSLNFVGLVFAIAALFADVLHLSANLMLIAALGAVLCFGISGVVVLHAMRKKKS